MNFQDALKDLLYHRPANPDPIDPSDRLFQQQLEKCGLARAVTADQPDLLAGIVLPRHAAEDVVRTVRFLDVFEAIKHGLTDNS